MIQQNISCGWKVVQKSGNKYIVQSDPFEPEICLDQSRNMPA